MKKVFLILLLLASGQCINAQAVNFDWAKSVGSTSDDQGNSIAVDRLGNVYSTGNFTGRVDFNPGADSFYLTSNGNIDFFILKLDGNGDFVWAHSIGGSANDIGNSISLDTLGNVYITGAFQGRVDFDPDTTRKFLNSLGRNDTYITKFNKNGKFIWTKQLGGKGDDQANGIAVANTGNVFITGYFSDTLMFTTSMTATRFVARSGTDIFVCKLDSNGNFGWFKQMGGTGNEAGNSIAVDKSDLVHTTGYFFGVVDFNPGAATSNLTSFGDADVFVSKLDANGNFVWARQLGGKLSDIGNSITLDASLNVITSGSFLGQADFNPGAGVLLFTSNGNVDVFISKLTTAGIYSWAKQIGGTGNDAGLCVTVDANSSIYTTGGFQGTVDFDPGTATYNLTSAGSDDAFLSKLNSSGTFLWAKNMGGGKSDLGNGIFVNPTKNVYSTGSYASRSDFDPSNDSFYVSPNGGLDAFVHKMAICKNSSSSIKASNCYSITINGETFTATGTYYQTLVNKTGCDSNITLNLTVHESTIAKLTVIACKSYTLNGVTYSTAGTYNQTLVNSNGCDSILILELSFGESKSNLTVISCNTYKLNANTYTSSGTYTQTVKNYLGCDSVITLKLTIKKSSSSTVNTTACNSYTLQTKTYTSSGTYTQIIKNYLDCDSVVTLNLIINKSTSTTLNKEACANYILNAQTYTKSGTYTQTLQNKKGCDSLIILNLKINNTTGTITTTSCKNYNLAGKLYTESGVYTQITTNTKGCDSLITLNLTVIKVLNTVTHFGDKLIADNAEAAYQWLDCNKGNTPIAGEFFQAFTPKISGNYAVKITKNNCTDTSVCKNIKVGKVENDLQGLIIIIPNPTNGETSILLSNSINNGTIKIMNSTGQTLQIASNLVGDNFKINLTHLATGLYFIELSENGNVWRTKFLRN